MLHVNLTGQRVKIPHPDRPLASLCVESATATGVSLADSDALRDAGCAVDCDPQIGARYGLTPVAEPDGGSELPDPPDRLPEPPTEDNG